MTLYLIGLGLNDEKDISIKGLEQVKKCKKVYLENYTAALNCKITDLEKFYEKKIILADRDLVEKKSEETILDDAKKGDVAFLIVGDPLSATTHVDLMLRAKELGIKTIVINNSSVFTAIAITGLQLYRFGRTASIPFPEKNFNPETVYEVIEQNQKNDMHTLVLLDLRPDQNKFMRANEGIKILLDIENKRNKKVFTRETPVFGCSRLGSPDAKIIFGKSGDLLDEDFGDGMHCLAVPAKKLHFIEEEMIKIYSR